MRSWRHPANLRTLLVSLLFALVPTIGSSDPQVVSTVEVSFSPSVLHLEPGERARVVLQADGVAGRPLAAFQLDLRFDPARLMLADPNGPFSGSVPAFAPLGGHPFCAVVREAAACDDPEWLLTSTGRIAVGVERAEPGRLVVAYGTHGDAFPASDSGALALLDVVAGSEGVAVVDLREAILADADEPPRPLEVTAGSLMVFVGSRPPRVPVQLESVGQESREGEPVAEGPAAAGSANQGGEASPVARFAARVTPHGVLLEWQAPGDVDPSRFRLRRGRGAAEMDVLAGRAIRTPTRSGSGVGYQFFDGDLQGPGAVQYSLELSDAPARSFAGGPLAVDLEGQVGTIHRSKLDLPDEGDLPLVADAGQELNARAGSKVRLDGSRSFDPDRDRLTFAWRLVFIPPGSTLTDSAIADAEGPAPSFTPDVAGLYLAELQVSDDQASERHAVLVTVSDAAEAPLNLDPTKDRRVVVGEPVIVAGGVSGGAGSNQRWRWRLDRVPQESRLGETDLRVTTAEELTFTADAAGLFEVGLEVDDGHESARSWTSVLAAAAEHGPVADAGTNLSARIGRRVELEGAGRPGARGAFTELTYTWRWVALPAGSHLRETDLVARGTGARFVPDAAGAYLLRLDVNDGESSDFDQVLVLIEAESEGQGSSVQRGDRVRATAGTRR